MNSGVPSTDLVGTQEQNLKIVAQLSGTTSLPHHIIRSWLTYVSLNFSFVLFLHTCLLLHLSISNSTVNTSIDSASTRYV